MTGIEMTPKVTLRAALEDPALLGEILGGETWAAWQALLLAVMGEPLEPDELELFRKFTGRSEPPPRRIEEFWGVIGRRGGKSKAISTLAVYLGGLCDYRDQLTRGETSTVMIIAPDQKQAQIILKYATGILENSPILSQLIARQTAHTLELTNGISIEVRAASFRRLRGMTCVAVIADEAAFWLSDDSANPDIEILGAVRPTLATTGGPLIVISSPHARRGAVWEAYRSHYGADGDPLILVAQGSSRDLNPSLPQSVVDRAYERDPAHAGAEYGAEFRTDIEGFVTLEAVRACTDDVRERPYDRNYEYTAFTDPSGGSNDSFTLAIAHREGKTSVLDVIREAKPPFSPEGAVEGFCALLRNYRINTVFGDRYAGEWPREQFYKHGVTYEPSERSKSELYRDALPLINSRTAALIEHPVLQRQLVALERRTARGGRDSIDHPPGGKDDVANAVAGVLVMAGEHNGNRDPLWDVPAADLPYPNRAVA
jgi:hypothetical protein